jgi:hypothetical protein
MMARVEVMKALNRHRAREFNSPQRDALGQAEAEVGSVGRGEPADFTGNWQRHTVA